MYKTHIIYSIFVCNEFVHSVNTSDTVCVEDEEYRNRIIIFDEECSHYEEDNLLSLLSETMENCCLTFEQSLCEHISRSEVLIDISSLNPNKDSIPGLIFSKKLLSLFEQWKSTVQIKLNFTESEYGKETTRCGAYYYVFSGKNQLCFEKLNSYLIDTNQIMLRRETKQNSVILDEDQWGVEMNNFPTIDDAMNSLLYSIKDPDQLGRYLHEEGFQSHVDLTYYGIYQPQVLITINNGFIELCSKLRLDWLDLDMMA